MSTINNLPFGAPSVAAGFGGALPMLESSPFEASPMQQADAISPVGTGAWGFGGAYGSYGGTALGAAGGLGGILGSFSSFISNLFNEIAGWFGMGSGAPSPVATSPGPVSGPGTPVSGGGSPISAPGSPGSGPISGYPIVGGGEQFYTSADASSWGDPHDSFSGTNANGQSVDGKWNSMASHADLLDSDSFKGGLRVSTQVTQPSSSGVTHNQSATVTTNGGNTQVTMNANGTTSITSYGRNYTVAAGQSINLGNGETVTANQNGSLTVNMTNSNGGSVAISLTAQGGGVNVSAQAQNVDLGGYLARQGTASPIGGSSTPPISSPVQAGSGPIGYGTGTPLPWQPAPQPFNFGALTNAFSGAANLAEAPIDASLI